MLHCKKNPPYTDEEVDPCLANLVLTGAFSSLLVPHGGNIVPLFMVYEN